MPINKYAIIVAGGSGSRMQSSVSKQFMLVGDRPILMHTIQRFYEADSAIDIIVVLPPLEIEIWSNIILI
jgi:2-C-methyl-D-erythritol 4-phosphate cytidylyltransferase